MKKHTIAIVDDHLLIAKAITGVIEKFPNYHVLFEAEHGKALIEKMKQDNKIPEIVLLDITMPVMDGFRTAEWLKKNHPSVLILALSMQNDDLSLIKMIRAGAKGYLLKNIHPAELNLALDELVSKGHYYPEWAASKLIGSMVEEPQGPPSAGSFTDRELEFMQFACSDLTYKEIAEKMYCSTRTVEGYRDIMFEKLRIKTRVALAVFAIKSGICKV